MQAVCPLLWAVKLDKIFYFRRASFLINLTSHSIAYPSQIAENVSVRCPLSGLVMTGSLAITNYRLFFIAYAPLLPQPPDASKSSVCQTTLVNFSFLFYPTYPIYST